VGPFEAVESVEESLGVEVTGGLVEACMCELVGELGGVLWNVASELLDGSALEGGPCDLVPSIAELDVVGARAETPFELEVLLGCCGVHAGREIGFESPFEVVQLVRGGVGTAVEDGGVGAFGGGYLRLQARVFGDERGSLPSAVVNTALDGADLSVVAQ
jgi:hypothetical protein